MFKTAIHALACLTLSLFATAGFGQEVRIGMGADITSIDPHAINITPNNNVSWHIFDTLAHVDEHTRARGIVARGRSSDLGVQT